MEFLNILKKLLNQIFFNDDFSSEEVAGLFSPAHFAYIFVFVIGMAVLIKLSLGMDKRKARKVRLLIAVSVTVMEVIKIALRVYKGQHISSWIPLYYCSLFIFAVWLSLIPSESISRIGKSYIAMGGAMAALIFTIVPTTSIAIFPALHIATVHSFIYHFLMFYSGIMLFIQEGYKPRLSDGVRYFLFISLATVPSLIINERFGANCMFLNDAFGLPFLSAIRESSHFLYMAIVFLAQSVLMFFGNFGFYKFAVHLKDKLKNKVKAIGEKNDVY